MVLERLDAQQKLTANQWKIAFAATIGDMLDFFDFGMIAFVLAFIVKDWHLTFGQSGMILLASVTESEGLIQAGSYRFTPARRLPSAAKQSSVLGA